MSTHITQNGSKAVVIRRSGHDPIASHPESGVSLADHLRSLGIAPEDHNVMIDGRSLAEVFVPPPGSVITVFPKPPGDEARQRTLSIGRFADVHCSTK